MKKPFKILCMLLSFVLFISTLTSCSNNSAKCLCANLYYNEIDKEVEGLTLFTVNDCKRIFFDGLGNTKKIDVGIMQIEDIYHLQFRYGFDCENHIEYQVFVFENNNAAHGFYIHHLDNVGIIENVYSKMRVNNIIIFFDLQDANDKYKIDDTIIELFEILELELPKIVFSNVSKKLKIKTISNKYNIETIENNIDKFTYSEYEKEFFDREEMKYYIPLEYIRLESQAEMNDIKLLEHFETKYVVMSNDHTGYILICPLNEKINNSNTIRKRYIFSDEMPVNILYNDYFVVLTDSPYGVDLFWELVS